MDDPVLAQFERDGFVPGPIVVRDTALDEARQAVTRLVTGTCPNAGELLLFRRERPDDPHSQVHIVGAWLAEQALRRLVFDPGIVQVVCGLMRTSAVRLFRDQLFVKAPRSQGSVPWHQDYSDWTHTTPAAHITCWIALDDATTANGCLYYLPGTHTGLRLPKIGRSDDMASAFNRLPDAWREHIQPKSAPIQAGACLFHHCLTVHGSFDNSTPCPRHAYAITYMHPDTRSASGQRPVIPNGPTVPEGHRLEGRLFPLLAA